MSESSITCAQCGMTSHNPNDVTRGYCGHCHDYTGAISTMVDGLPFDEVAKGMFFDKQGHPITLARYVWLMRPERLLAYRRVGWDEIGPFTVSTVWLGVDHGFGMCPRPVIFETMVFLSGTPEDLGMQRYATEDEALAGHEATVAEIRVLDERAADRERIQDQQ